MAVIVAKIESTQHDLLMARSLRLPTTNELKIVSLKVNEYVTYAYFASCFICQLDCLDPPKPCCLLIY
jgi:hypothetical protein